MKLKGTIVYTFIVCVILGVVLSLYHSKELSGRKKVSVTFDAAFSKQFKNEVFAFVREQERITTTPEVWSDLLKDRFPAVKSVIIRVSEKKMFVKLKPNRPLALVNKEFVLLESGALVSRYYFIKIITKSLKAVTITEKNMGKLHVSAECKSFIERCDRGLCKRYTMTWNNPTHIELHNKYHKNITVLTTMHADLGKTTEQYCQMLADKLMGEPRKKNKKWNIDIRFKNQIIVAMR